MNRAVLVCVAIGLSLVAVAACGKVESEGDAGTGGAPSGSGGAVNSGTGGAVNSGGEDTEVTEGGTAGSADTTPADPGPCLDPATDEDCGPARIYPIDLPLEVPGAATAVSRDGSVVVGVKKEEQSLQGFRWTRDSGVTRLSDGGHEEPTAVNADGSIVVGNPGFIWDEANGVRDLEMPVGSTPVVGAAVTSISDDGSVVAGGYERQNVPGMHIFRWQAGEAQDLGTFPGGDDAVALGMDAEGRQLVGTGFDLFLGDDNRENFPFIWRVGDTTITRLDLGVDEDWGAGRAISGDGSVILGSFGRDLKTYGFVHRGQAPVDLLAEGWSPDHVSTDGRLIVGASDDGVWISRDGAFYLLEDVLRARGTDLTGWGIKARWLHISGISGDGRVLVGDAYRDGWLWNQPFIVEL
jgi:hypothetical protein